MTTETPANAKLPPLDELGRDLLATSSAQRIWSIARPLICFAAYFVFAFAGWWVPAVLAVAGLMFITYVSTSHDLLHRTLGFSRGVNDVLLAVIEALVLRSGHAFRVTHLQHHRRFPHDDDVEGAVARMPLWRALLAGIGHQTRLFLWAWPRARTEERVWMVIEASWMIGFVVASAAFAKTTPVLFVFVMLVITSSWLYPYATVWVPHRAEGESVVRQTIGVRGRIVPELFLQHTYHLEHHLYPSVPSHNWRKLARRLDPWLRENGARLVHLP